MLRNFHNLDSWTKLVVFYLWGSLLLGKSSAFVGLALGALLILSRSVLWDRWCIALTQRGDPLSPFAWAILVSLVYGVAQVIYGVLSGYPLVTALEVLIFNICPIYVFLGIWVGTRDSGLIRRYIRYTAWFAVIYTPLYFLFFSKLHLSLSGILPGTSLDLLSSPGSGSGTLLGLLAYEPTLAPFWLPVMVLVCLTIANQIRADWLGLGVGLIIWGILAKKMHRVFAVAGLASVVLLIAFLADLRLPAIPGRGGELSARDTVARMAGSISPGMAESMGAGRANAEFYYGTVYWRTRWWRAIREEVSTDYTTLMFGLGYGYPLGKLNSSAVEREGVRSPHNIFYFALAYSGWVGVAIFFWLEACIFRLLWRAYKTTGKIYVLAYFAGQFLGYFFGNAVETPQGGIFIYLLIGLYVGPMFLPTATEESAANVASLFPYTELIEEDLGNRVPVHP
jgi:O-Antigen ligase